MEKNNLALPVAIIIAGVLVAGAMFYTNKDSAKAPVAPQKSATEQVNVAQPNSDDRITGSSTADVIIIEYSDTECPFCKVFHNTMQQIMTQYGKDGKVAWIYRYMPLDTLHKKARNEAQAVECARDQGGNDTFWKYVDEVYSRTNSNDSLPETELSKIASDLKLDVKKWSTCLSSGVKAPIIAASEQTGVDAGVQGTPNNFLIFKKPLSDNQINNLVTAFSKFPEGTIKISTDGKIVNLGGAMPYNLMTLVIDNALQGK